MYIRRRVDQSYRSFRIDEWFLMEEHIGVL